MTIWKFPIETTDVQSVRMPDGAKILSVGMQAGKITLWALVDPNKPTNDLKRIHVVGTGNRFPLNEFEDFSFIGTVFDRVFVWHIFAEELPF